MLDPVFLGIALIPVKPLKIRHRNEIIHIIGMYIMAVYMSIFLNLRVRQEITLHFQESRHPHGKTRGRRIASYLRVTERSRAGWIGASKCEIIFD